MALNIDDYDNFGFLSSADLSTLSPTLKQQSAASPVGSESSSGISSLDSDDLKKQLSSPTISQDEEDPQSDGTTDAADEKDKVPEEPEDDKPEDDDAFEPIKEDKKVEKILVLEPPVKVIYQNRDILDLSKNTYGLGQLVQYTVLPENNVNCFFQNRAQYYRLSSAERVDHPIEKCSCCDFTYPSTHPQLHQGPMVNDKNAITDSILAFLKSTEPMNVGIQKRIMNNNTPFGYQMQQQQTPHPYMPPQSNGFYNNANANNYNQPSMNPFINNGSGYGSTLALLNLMNTATRNTANAFQAISTGANNPRYYNNNMNNNFGLYKQF